MKKGLVRNTIVLIIVLSFFGTAVVIGISTDQSKISKNSIEDKQYNNDTEIINQNKIKSDNLIENKNLSYTMNQKTPISSFKRSTTLYVGGSGVGNY